MQLLISKSKYLALAVLSCVLFVAWFEGSNNYDPVMELVINTSDDTASSVSRFDAADSFWSSIREEFTLDRKTQTAQVQAEIRSLLADQENLYRILKAAGPYIYYIHAQTQARGLPAELALIPVIESEYNPNDHSNKGATGLWQLMPGTAKELGIKVKSGYDGRRNVVESTKAALAYFNDLGKCFDGNWYLAIAAYNCGQVKIQSAVRRAGTHSFWNLHLPKETKHYVPKLLAVAEIIKHPEKYGVELPPIQNKPYFTTVTVNKPVLLAKVAESTGIKIDTLHTLNPDYNHGTPSNKVSQTLLVPINKLPQVKAHLAEKIVTL